MKKPQPLMSFESSYCAGGVSPKSSGSSVESRANSFFPLQSPPQEQNMSSGVMDISYSSSNNYQPNHFGVLDGAEDWQIKSQIQAHNQNQNQVQSQSQVQNLNKSQEEAGLVYPAGGYSGASPYAQHHHLGSQLVDPRTRLQGGVTQNMSGYHPTVMGGRPQQPMLNSNRTGGGQAFGSYPQNAMRNYGGSGQYPGQYPGQGYGAGNMGQYMNMPPPPVHDGKSLNKIMLGIMRDRVFNPSKLTAVLDSNLDIMDCVNLATLLFHTGKKRFTLPRTLVQRIANRFNEIDGELRAREASNAMYGLRCMNPECPEVRQLIVALTHKFAASPTKLVAQAVGNAVYGLQSLTSEYEEVRGLLLVLAPKISQCREQLEAQNVGNALYGMKGMSSDHAEVRMLLAALTPKIADVCETLNGQAIGNSLYGLQCCNSRDIEVRGVLHVLTLLIARSWDSLNTQEIGNAMYGLQRMSSDVVEVRALLQAMTAKIAQSAASLDAQAVGNALYGMKNMNSDSPEVLVLLEVLAQKIRSSSLVLDGQSIGNGIYGLQAMDSAFPEVRFLVRVLAHKVAFSPVKMNPQELGDAMFGLRRMSADYEEVRELLSALQQKFSNCRAVFSVQEISNMLLGMQGMSSDHAEVRSLLEVMTEKIASNKTPFDGHSCANCISGMELMSSEHHEVVRLVAVLTMKLRSSAFEHMTPKQIAMCFTGCGRLSFSVPEVAQLMTALGEKLVNCGENFTPLQLAMLMQGLKGTYIHPPEVHMILSGITGKVDLLIGAAASGEIDPRFLLTFDLLALAINGLQGMGPLRTECNKGMGRGGLYSLSNTAEVGATDGDFLLDELVGKLTELFCVHNGLIFPGVMGGAVDIPSNISLNFMHTDSRTFSDLLFGLQRMESSKSSGLVALLEVVRAVCSAAVGSHQVESDEFHVRVDIAVSVGNSMLGLIGCDASMPCVDYLLKTAVVKLEDVVTLFRSVCLDYDRSRGNNAEEMKQQLVYTRMIGLYQPLILSLHSLKSTMSSELHTRFSAQMDIIRQLVGARYAELHPLLYQISGYEMMLAECLHNGIQQQGCVGLSTNDLLYGFPSTILITCTPASSPTQSVQSESELERLVLGDVLEESTSGSGTGVAAAAYGSSPGSPSAPVLINVEVDLVDASTHQYPTTRLLCFLREKYLGETKGISVVHLPPLQLLQCCDSLDNVTTVLQQYFSMMSERAPGMLSTPSLLVQSQMAGIVINYVAGLHNNTPAAQFPQLSLHSPTSPAASTHVPVSLPVPAASPAQSLRMTTAPRSMPSSPPSSSPPGLGDALSTLGISHISSYELGSMDEKPSMNVNAMYYPGSGLR